MARTSTTSASPPPEIIVNANDILRLVRRAQQEPDRLDRERLMRRAREEASRLSDEDFERVERALRSKTNTHPMRTTMPHAKKSVRRSAKPTRKRNAAPTLSAVHRAALDRAAQQYGRTWKAEVLRRRTYGLPLDPDVVHAINVVGPSAIRAYSPRKANAPRSRQAPYGGSIEPGLIEDWRSAMPRGTRLYGVLKSRAGGDTVKVVFAGDDGRIYHVPPNMGIAAGYRHNREKDGFLLGGRGIPGIAQALGTFLHGDARAFDAEPYSYL